MLTVTTSSDQQTTYTADTDANNDAKYSTCSSLHLLQVTK